MSGERLEKALHAMPNINHGSIDKGAYRLALSELAQAVREAVESIRSKPVGVEVKPLEWISLPIPMYSQAIVLGGPGRYLTNNFGNGWVLWFPGEEPSTHKGRWFDKHDEVRAAAEADYRHRILSTLCLPEQEPVATTGDLEHRIFNTLVHDYPAPYAKVTSLAKKLAALYASPQPEAVITDGGPSLRMALIKIKDRLETAFGAGVWDMPAVNPNGQSRLDHQHAALFSIIETCTAALDAAK